MSDPICHTEFDCLQLIAAGITSTKDVGVFTTIGHLFATLSSVAMIIYVMVFIIQQKREIKAQALVLAGYKRRIFDRFTRLQFERNQRRDNEHQLTRAYTQDEFDSTYPCPLDVIHGTEAEQFYASRSMQEYDFLEAMQDTMRADAPPYDGVINHSGMDSNLNIIRPMRDVEQGFTNQLCTQRAQIIIETEYPQQPGCSKLSSLAQ